MFVVLYCKPKEGDEKARVETLDDAKSWIENETRNSESIEVLGKKETRPYHWYEVIKIPIVNSPKILYKSPYYLD